MLHLTIISIVCAVSALCEGTELIRQINYKTSNFCRSDRGAQNKSESFSHLLCDKDYNISSATNKSENRTHSLFQNAYQYYVNYTNSSYSSNFESKKEISHSDILDVSFSKRNILWIGTETKSLKISDLRKHKVNKKNKLKQKTNTLTAKERKQLLRLKRVKTKRKSEGLDKVKVENDLDHLRKKIEEAEKKTVVNNQLAGEISLTDFFSFGEVKRYKRTPTSKNLCSHRVFEFSTKQNITQKTVKTENNKTIPSNNDNKKASQSNSSRSNVRLKRNIRQYQDNRNHRIRCKKKTILQTYKFLSPESKTVMLFPSPDKNSISINKKEIGQPITDQSLKRDQNRFKTKRIFNFNSTEEKISQKPLIYFNVKNVNFSPKTITEPKNFENLNKNYRKSVGIQSQLNDPSNDEDSEKSFHSETTLERPFINRDFNVIKRNSEISRDNYLLENNYKSLQASATPTPFISAKNMLRKNIHSHSVRRKDLKLWLKALKNEYSMRRRKRCGAGKNKAPHKCWRSAPLLCIPYIRKGQDDLLKCLIKNMEKMLGKPYPQKVDIFEKTKFKPFKKKKIDNSFDDVIPCQESDTYDDKSSSTTEQQPSSEDLSENYLSKTTPTYQIDAFCPASTSATTAKPSTTTSAYICFSATSSYPRTSSKYSSTSSISSTTTSTCPMTASTFPTTGSAFTTTVSAFSTTASTFPTTTSTCPTTTSTCPTTASTFPTTGSAFTTTVSAFSTTASTFPTTASTFPTTASAFSTTASTCPTTASTCPTTASTCPTTASTCPTTASTFRTTASTCPTTASTWTTSECLTTTSMSPVIVTTPLPSLTNPVTISTPSTCLTTCPKHFLTSTRSSYTTSYYPTLTSSTVIMPSKSSSKNFPSSTTYLITSTPYPTICPPTPNFFSSRRTYNPPYAVHSACPIDEYRITYPEVHTETTMRFSEKTTPQWPPQINTFSNGRPFKHKPYRRNHFYRYESPNIRFKPTKDNYNKFGFNKNFYDTKNDFVIEEVKDKLGKNVQMRYNLKKMVLNNGKVKGNVQKPPDEIPALDYNEYGKYFLGNGNLKRKNRPIPRVLNRNYLHKIKEKMTAKMNKRRKRSDNSYNAPQAFEDYNNSAREKHDNDDQASYFENSMVNGEERDEEAFFWKKKVRTPPTYQLFSDLAKAFESVIDLQNKTSDFSSTEETPYVNSTEITPKNFTEIETMTSKNRTNTTSALPKNLTEVETITSNNVTETKVTIIKNTTESKTTSHNNLIETVTSIPFITVTSAFEKNNSKSLINNSIMTFKVVNNHRENVNTVRRTASNSSALAVTTESNVENHRKTEATHTTIISYNVTGGAAKNMTQKHEEHVTKQNPLHSLGKSLEKQHKELESIQTLDNEDVGQIPTTLKIASIVKGPKRLIGKPAPKQFPKVFPDFMASNHGTTEAATTASVVSNTMKSVEKGTTGIADVRLQLLATCEGYLEALKLIRGQSSALGEELDPDLTRYCENIISQSFNSPENSLKPKNLSAIFLGKSQNFYREDEHNSQSLKSRASTFKSVKEVLLSKLHDKVIASTLTNPIHQRQLSEKVNKTATLYELKKLRRNATKTQKYIRSPKRKLENGFKEKFKKIQNKKEGLQQDLMLKGMPREEAELLQTLRKKKAALISWLLNSSEDEVKENGFQQTESLKGKLLDKIFKSSTSGTVTHKGDGKTGVSHEKLTDLKSDTIYPVYAKKYGYDSGGELKKIEVMWRKIDPNTHEAKVFKNLTVFALLLTSTTLPFVTDELNTATESTNSISSGKKLESLFVSDSSIDISEPQATLASTTTKTVPKEEDITMIKTPRSSNASAQLNSNIKPPKSAGDGNNSTFTYMNKPDVSLIIASSVNNSDFNNSTSHSNSSKTNEKKLDHQNFTKKISHEMNLAKNKAQEYGIDFLNYSVYILPIMFSFLFLICCIYILFFIWNNKRKYLRIRRKKKKKKRKQESSEDDTETTDTESELIQKKKTKKRSSKDSETDDSSKKLGKSIWALLKAHSAKQNLEPTDEAVTHNSQTEKGKNFFKYFKYKKEDDKIKDEEIYPSPPPAAPQSSPPETGMDSSLVPTTASFSAAAPNDLTKERDDNVVTKDHEPLKKLNIPDSSTQETEKNVGEKVDKPKVNSDDEESESNDRKEIIALLNELKEIEIEQMGEKKETNPVHVQYFTLNSGKRDGFGSFNKYCPYASQKRYHSKIRYTNCSKHLPMHDENTSFLQNYEAFDDIDDLDELFVCDCNRNCTDDGLDRWLNNNSKTRKCENIIRVFKGSEPYKKKSFFRKEMNWFKCRERSALSKFKNASTDTSEELLGGSHKNAETQLNVTDGMIYNCLPRYPQPGKVTNMSEQYQTLKCQLNKKKCVRLKDGGVLCRL